MGEVFLTVEGLAVKRLLPHLQRDKRFLELFLSEVKVAEFEVPFLTYIAGQPYTFKGSIDRSVFEKIIQPYIERSLEVTRRLLANAKHEIDDVHDIVLVGGQTRTPAVRDAVFDFLRSALITFSGGPRCKGCSKLVSFWQLCT